MTDTPVPPHAQFVRFAESFLHYGDTPHAVGWLRGDADTRYRVMLDVIRPAERPVTLLDFGCGLSHLNDYILSHGLRGITYSGLDLSDRFLAGARAKYPGVTYYQCDLLDASAPSLPAFDYVVMNGIFTYKGPVPFNAMLDYVRALIRRVFSLAEIGVAFNFITKQVEWERDDLFHLPVDTLLTFLSNEISRHVVIRHDYGLFEYTAYVYKAPSAPEHAGAKLLLGRRPPT